MLNFFILCCNTLASGEDFLCPNCSLIKKNWKTIKQLQLAHSLPPVFIRDLTVFQTVHNWLVSARFIFLFRSARAIFKRETFLGRAIFSSFLRDEKIIFMLLALKIFFIKLQLEKARRGLFLSLLDEDTQANCDFKHN
jgi:hypothetical protein